VNLTAQDEIAVYVEGVREALAGLPAATRDELLEDLPEHLAEVLAEGGGSLYERLGPPAAYAAELSASAGVTAGAPPEGERSRIAATAARHRARIDRALRRADEQAGPVFGYPRASEFLALLRPAWWVLRGYVAAMAVAFMLHDHSRPLGLLPRVGGDALAAVLLLSLGVLGSIWLGRRGRATGRWSRRLRRLGTGFLVVFAVIGFFTVDSAAQRDYYYHVDYTEPRLDPYRDIQDVFVYDGEGRLLKGVQLYDQKGQPIQLGEASCTDENDNAVPIANPGYPFCPHQAPFPTPEPRADDPSAGPALSTAPSTGPSAGGDVPPPATPTTPTAPNPTR
jgi:hypothetical protein